MRVNRDNTITVGVGRETIRYFTYPEKPLGPGQFEVKTLYSGISAGTELSFFRGTNLYQFFDHNPETEEFTSKQEPDFSPLPFVGYMEVGVVEASRSQKVREGDTVCCSYGHKTAHVLHEDDFYVPLPQDINPLIGIYVAQFGPICANLFAHADLFEREFKGNVRELGESVRGKTVAVWGGGPIGMMTALFARHAGAQVALIDLIPTRLNIAKRLGCTPISNQNGDAHREIRSHWPKGADISVDCTGNYRVLNTLMKAAATMSNVYLLSYYQGKPDELRLDIDFHHRGLSLIGVQINNLVKGSSHRLLAAKTLEVLHNNGKDIQDMFISHIVPFSDAQTAFEALADKPSLLEKYARRDAGGEIMQVVLQPDEDLSALMSRAQPLAL